MQGVVPAFNIKAARGDILCHHGSVERYQAGAIGYCREQAGDVAASEQHFRCSRQFLEVERLKQVVAAVAAADADQRRDVIPSPKFLKFLRASLNCSGKVQITIENVLPVNWLAAHAAQAFAAAEKRLAVEAAGRSQNAYLVPRPQRRRLDGWRLSHEDHP